MINFQEKFIIKKHAMNNEMSDNQTTNQTKTELLYFVLLFLKNLLIDNINLNNLDLEIDNTEKWNILISKPILTKSQFDKNLDIFKTISQICSPEFWDYKIFKLLDINLQTTVLVILILKIRKFKY